MSVESEPDWQPLARSALVAGRKVIVAPQDVLSECLRRSKLLQKARDEGSLRTLVGLFAGQSATVLEAPPASKSPLDVDGMCKIRTNIGTTASLPFGSIGVDPEAERQMKLKYEHNAVHDIAATEVQEVWRRANLRRKALAEVRKRRQIRDLKLMEERNQELNRQEMMVRNMAATTIQAAVRGTLTRSRMKPNEAETPFMLIHQNSTAEKKITAERAATTLEKTFRGALYRKHEHDQQQDYMQYDDANDTSDISERFLNACISGDLHRVHTIHRDHGVNVHVADAKGNSGVMCACPGGHVDVVKFLLSVGGSLSMKNFTGWTPLHRACFYGQEALVEYVIDKLARQGISENPLASTNHLGATPLHVAIPNGHKSVCDLLILRGAPLEAKNASGDTALSFAVICRKPEIVSMLLKSGADVNTRNKEGLTPFEIAEKLGQPEIARLLSPSSEVLRSGLSKQVSNQSEKTVPLFAQRNKKRHSNSGRTSSNNVFRNLNVPASTPPSPRDKDKSSTLKEDTKAIDGLLQNCSAVWSRREIVRRAWLGSCPLCHNVKMKLHEVHTILHVLGILPNPPNKANLSQDVVKIRLDSVEHTCKDLKNAAEMLGVSSQEIYEAHGEKTRSKLLSLIRCPKGAIALIAERKRAAEMGEATGKCLLQRLDVPDNVIDNMATTGKDLVAINAKTLVSSTLLDGLPSVIKYRLLFHCEILRKLAELERQTKLRVSRTKSEPIKPNEEVSESKQDIVQAEFNMDSESLEKDSHYVAEDISVHSDLLHGEAEDGGWVTEVNFQVGLEPIQVAHFEELVTAMSGGATLSAEDLKVARRAASSRGKVVSKKDKDKVLVGLKDGFQATLPMQAVYLVPQVLTPNQLYVGANARVVKFGWLRQLLHTLKTNPAMSSNSSLSHEEQDILLADRLGGALVVVKEVHPDRVKVQTADGFESSLPINSLCPPPIDAALKLLFRNSVSSTSDHSPNFDVPKARASHKPPQSRSSNLSSKKAKHAVNLNMTQPKASRPLYREEGEQDDGVVMQQRHLKPTKINNNPYVPEKMLNDSRISDQLNRGLGGKSNNSSQRPRTAQARFGTTTQGETSTGRFNETDENSAESSQPRRSRGGQQTRPATAQPHGRQAAWTPLNVQTFDFKPAMKKKEEKKKKPDFKFGISGGVRKSVDLRTNSDLPSTAINGSHTRSQISSPRENISPLKGGSKTRRFEEDDEAEYVLPSRERVVDPVSRKTRSTLRRPASAGVSRSAGAYSDATWSFGRHPPTYGESRGMAETLRSTVTRQQQHGYQEAVDEEEPFTHQDNRREVEDEDIRAHVEHLIDEHSGRWAGNGGLDSPNKRSQMSHSNTEEDKTDALFREQLDRMEEQMARKERQIREALTRQKKASEASKQSMRRSQKDTHRHSRKLEETHRRRREDLFKTDIGAEVDERLMNEEQTWREADYAASEMAFAMDSLSESLNREKGRELEIRRKLKSLSQQQHKTEAMITEIHKSMGAIKMSRSDGPARVLALEAEISALSAEHEHQGKELRSQQVKLEALRKNAEAAEALTTAEISDLDRDARLIHSIELKSNLLRNRRKELIESTRDVEMLLKDELRRYEDHTSQLTIADVAVKAMKSVVGNFAGTSSST